MLRVPTAGVGEVMVHDAVATPRFAGSKVTVAVIVEVPVGQGCDGQASSVRGLAARETTMAAKVICVDPCAVGELAELAVMVTCTSAAGGVAGEV